ncbi:MAG TPA: VOC family protein [Candidatus Acidoferrales bacterium]|nr:VOC family protein [Candidatus Acidoferrales bacterium]
MKRVTGIGGIFFKCENPESILRWYNEHLGISPVGESAVFEWMQKEKAGEYGHTVWGPFERVTKYFHPSTKDFMINYRVENLEALIERLREEGVEIVGDIEKYDYGKFGWIMDPEGNKIELWEPDDKIFRKTSMLDG